MIMKFLSTASLALPLLLAAPGAVHARVNECGGGDILIQYTQESEARFSDAGSGSAKHFTGFRLGNTNPSTWFRLGDVAINKAATSTNFDQADTKGVLVHAYSDIFAPPTDFVQTWTDTNSDASSYNVAFWKPVAPPGYTCLGDVFGALTKPSTNIMRCVKNSYVVEATTTEPAVWDDVSSGSAKDGKIWRVTPKGKGLNIYTLSLQISYTKPTDSIYTR